MIRARLIYRSRNGTTLLKGEHRLDGASVAGVGGRPRTSMQRRPALPRRKYTARVPLDNYSLDWYPRFGRIPPPLPSSSVPRPAATPCHGRGQPALPKTGGEVAKTGGEEGLGFRRRVLCRNILYGATWGSARIAWCGRAPAQWAAGSSYSGPWAPD